MVDLFVRAEQYSVAAANDDGNGNGNENGDDDVEWSGVVVNKIPHSL